jgi:hypothetical protein
VREENYQQREQKDDGRDDLPSVTFVARYHSPSNIRDRDGLTQGLLGLPVKSRFE